MNIQLIFLRHMEHFDHQHRLLLEQSDFAKATSSRSTKLVHGGVLSAPTAIRALTIGPARALGIAAGTLAAGSRADVTLIDPDVRWTIDPTTFRSRSRNTPFTGRAVRGRAAGVCLAGRVVDHHLGGRFAQ